MIFGKVALAATLSVLSSGAFAQDVRKVIPLPGFGIELGTPEQRAACHPDVQRLCQSVPADAGPFVFLACLKEHRAQLSKPCLGVLESNGQ